MAGSGATGHGCGCSRLELPNKHLYTESVHWGGGKLRLFHRRFSRTRRRLLSFFRKYSRPVGHFSPHYVRRADPPPSPPVPQNVTMKTLSQVLYTIKARTVVMISSSRGAGLSTEEAAAEALSGAGDEGSMTSAALERVVTQATAAYNEW